MAKKYIYKASFDEKVAMWCNIDAVIVSNKPLTENELNAKIKNFEYDEISSNFDYTDGMTRLEVSPVYDYEETTEEENEKKI